MIDQSKIDAYKAEVLDSLIAYGIPKCSGDWIGGSGGHRTHTPCAAWATRWTWDDMWAYCDTHYKAHDNIPEAPWAAALLEKR